MEAGAPTRPSDRPEVGLGRPLEIIVLDRSCLLGKELPPNQLAQPLALLALAKGAGIQKVRLTHPLASLGPGHKSESWVGCVGAPPLKQAPGLGRAALPGKLPPLLLALLICQCQSTPGGGVGVSLQRLVETPSLGQRRGGGGCAALKLTPLSAPVNFHPSNPHVSFFLLASGKGRNISRGVCVCVCVQEDVMGGHL